MLLGKPEKCKFKIFLSHVIIDLREILYEGGA
jgi:hypothetical protein